MDYISLFLEQKRREASQVFYIENIIKASSGKEYEIQERLSNGGNAVVYKCVERITGEEYAIKFQLTPSNRKRIARFKKEITILKEIKHKQLMTYIDEGEVTYRQRKDKVLKIINGKTIPYVIMRLASENLSDFLKKGNSMQYSEYMPQFRGLAEALSVLHEKAIHRDIKPENILISGETWILSDFGLCKFNAEDASEDLTGDNEVVGPRYWMSPEALNKHIGNKDEIQKCSDVYQLCSIFWYVVTGRHPLGIVSSQDWEGSEELFQVIYDSLSHDSSKRPFDGQELLTRINEAIVM